MLVQIYRMPPLAFLAHHMPVQGNACHLQLPQSMLQSCSLELQTGILRGSTASPG